ncbi:histidine kinase [Fulvivirga lutimaris]|uniref:histidine kinase n=1 Tax=Fulvivirga lutimaris TaxID=1819566 RepID=UPI0012BBE04E|nr:sensor histidine kinase [Fulvivirga lutimaris]MTI41648.1 regulator [Fulvivirga lutimaris]
MNFRLRQLFHYISLIFLMISCAKAPVFKKYETVYKIGDQQTWASKDWDDKDWKKGDPILDDGRVFWLRTPIDILQDPERPNPYGIRLEIYGEYEVFWDGILIGKNGNPGLEATRAPEGKIWATFIIPEHQARKGEHLLAIRGSLYYFPDHTGIWSLNLDYYDNLLTDSLIQNSYMHVFAGAFLIISLYFLFLFLNNKKEYPTLIFSICCFLIFALALTVFSTDYIPIHYSVHVIRLQIISSFLLGISFLIPLYFSMQFPYPRQRLLLILYAAVLVFIFLFRHDAFDFKAVGMVLSMWCFSFCVVTYGAYNHIKGARLVLATLLLSMIIFLTFGFVISLYAGLGLILLGMLYLVALRIKDQRLAYENSLVQSTRLQLELLKKNIQPHFLMNTLTSLIDWVEESPKKGVLFIEALAKEFDLVNQMENHTLIPVNQEIELCKTHLEIMEYRKEINYVWEDEGIDSSEKIPPGILHTLLENGITHSLPQDDNIIMFKLCYDANNEFRRYTFLTFAKENSKKEPIEGTGIKYVKARLEESYQSKWSFTSEATDSGWKNEIIIYY